MNCIGTEDVLKKWGIEENQKNEKAPLVKVIDNAIMTVDGCLDENRQIVKESLCFRGVENQLIGRQPKVNINVNNEVEEAYFIGFASKHWGHYLTETLARCHQLGDKRIFSVFYAGNISRVQKLFPQHQYTKIKENFLVKKLYIPIPSMVNRLKVSLEHIDFCRKCGDLYGRDYAPSKKLYLSRTALPRGYRWIEAEVELESMLEKHGWKIVHFSKIPVSRQIGLLENANFVAGCIGSAFHNLMMTRKNPGKVIYLSDNNPNPNYALHDFILNNQSAYLLCQEETNKAQRQTKIIDPKAVLEYLQDTSI